MKTTRDHSKGPLLQQRTLMSFLKRLTVFLILAVILHVSVPGFENRTMANGSGPANPTSFNLIAYGADPTGVQDSHPAFQRVFQQIARERLQHAVVIVPAGRFKLSRRVDFDPTPYLSSTSEMGLSIRGDGIRTTTLLVDNHSGFFSYNSGRKNINGVSITIRDLSVVAGREGAGIAVTVAKQKAGVRRTRQLVMENVVIRGQEQRTYFNGGVVAKQLWFPRFHNVIVAGLHKAQSTEADRAKMGVALDLRDSYQPNVQDCHITNARIGLHYSTERHANSEDGQITSSYFVGVQQGLVLRLEADQGKLEEVGLHISNNHINYRDRGIWIVGLRQANISHNLFYCSDRMGATKLGGTPGPARNYTPIDIDVSYGSSLIIDGNVFTEAANPKRVAVHLGNSSHVLIRGNQFNNEGTGIRNVGRGTNFAVDNMFGGRQNFGPDQARYVDWHRTLRVRDLP